MSTDHHLREVSYQLLAERGVSLEAIAELVLFCRMIIFPI
ncbi:putative low temperature requirement C protein [Streptococcus pyogenes]|nr:low temperature requirement C protein [Streptococcus pyogenes]VGV48646.1 putative low temperature requirement C protein [Streptococcus pyogenes]VGV68609.1 putative low temperature requirement C protein [Streptococcus pyogenes]VHA86277.1 putative low temperature requirement C protein [Streptococcus pyogenes]